MNFTQKDIEDYCIHHSTTVSKTAEALQKFTQDGVHGSQMLIGKMEAAFLSFIIKITKAKNILELGTYTGYSALIMAEALPIDGKVTTIDIDKNTTEIAKRFWQESTCANKINLLLGPGLEMLKTLNQKFDLIFIDADKNNYLNYLKWSLEHLSDNGVIITDNALWSGRVLEKTQDPQTLSIQEHNEFAAKLENYQKVLLPIRDGMFLITKKN